MDKDIKLKQQGLGQPIYTHRPICIYHIDMYVYTVLYTSMRIKLTNIIYTQMTNHLQKF